MKALISVALTALVIGGVSTSRADSGTDGQAQPSPTLTWNRIALETVERAKPTQHQAIRLLAHVSLAQYATMAQGDDDPVSRDAVAAASIKVIAELMPSQAAFVEERNRGLDPRAAENGRRIAQGVLAEAGNDGFAKPWSGDAPHAADAWRSLASPPKPPAYPAIGAMRTFFLKSGSDFRSPAPPALDSSRFLTDLAEVRRHTEAPTEDSRRIAKFYDMTTGTLVAGYWNERATDLIRGGPIGELQAAGILATMNAAMMDAIVACHDAKYTYWVPRPSQADPAIKPLIGVPNHPSYPSNHACVSTAAALVLAHFFPQARSGLEATASEAGLSRIYAGIHYRFDVEAGEEIGRKVAAVAIARHPQMLLKWQGRESAQPAAASAMVPDKLRPTAHESLAMIVPAKGMQIYECRAGKDSEGQYDWAFVGPEAELFDADGAPIGRHYGGPHWEANDGSKIVGTVKERTDAPVSGAIPWLLLATKSVGGEGSFSKVTSIQRVDTAGGVAPKTGCSRPTLGTSARIAYTADYYFFTSK